MNEQPTKNFSRENSRLSKETNTLKRNQVNPASLMTALNGVVRTSGSCMAGGTGAEEVIVA